VRTGDSHVGSLGCPKFEHRNVTLINHARRGDEEQLVCHRKDCSSRSDAKPERGANDDDETGSVSDCANRIVEICNKTAPIAFGEIAPPTRRARRREP
jgi:hypothetical protein